jgi:hypothetical protein
MPWTLAGWQQLGVYQVLLLLRLHLPLCLLLLCCLSTGTAGPVCQPVLAAQLQQMCALLLPLLLVHLLFPLYLLLLLCPRGVQQVHVQ